MHQKPRVWSWLSIVLLLATLVPAVPVASAPAAPPDPLAQLSAETGGGLRVGYHRATGQVNFLSTAAGQPWRAAGLSAQAAPAARAEVAARQFLTTYGALFGLDAQAGLSVRRNVTRADGRTYVRFQQQHLGVPIFGAELIVQLDAAQAVEVVIGEAQPKLGLAVIPSVSAAAAVNTALATTAHVHGVPINSLQAGPAALWIYNPALTEPRGGPIRLVWRVEVTPLALTAIRELVLVDAVYGGVALQFNQTHAALNRRTYDGNNLVALPGTLICDETNPTCTGGDTHEVAAHIFAGDTYDFYADFFGRDSIDDAGLTLISTVHHNAVLAVPYDNAFWNGAQMVYGDAYGYPLADDVVAHELTHGVTQYESGLFYYYQSGAINEALSDVFGEFMDQTNLAGSDTGPDKWLLGEDITGLGAIRDMENPPAFNDPDHMKSTFYKSASGDLTDPSFDNGGVHTNSGLLNKLASLLTDGGTLTITVSAIGITKTAQIIYHTATNLLTSGSDYLDLYNALASSCTTLIGQFGIGAGDCTEVVDATNATQMHLEPVTGFNPHAALCPGVETLATDLFTDGLEANANNWTFSALTGANRWGRGSDFARTGQFSLFGNNLPAAASDSVAAMAAGVLLPVGAYLHFEHAYGFKGTGPDGGIVEYSIDGGTVWTNAAALFQVNPYNGVINAGPLSGSAGFVNDSHGYISSRLVLSSLAGESVRFRFRLSDDLGAANEDYGWFVDDVRLYTCSGNPGTIERLYLPLVARNLGSAGGYTDIITEGFEGAWPSTGWTLTDPGFQQYYWGKRNCQSASGGNSAWAMGAGISGTSLSCGANYINGANAWMIYGPFSLAAATEADLSLRFRLNVAAGDELCQFASLNGSQYFGQCIGSADNTNGVFAAAPMVFDLTNVFTLGDLTGDNAVWIAVVFRSNGSGNLPIGAYVDDIVLRQCVGSCPALNAAALAAGDSQHTHYSAEATAPADLSPGTR